MCECVDKWKLMRKKVLFFCNGKNLANYSNQTWLYSGEMSLAVVQKDEAVEKERDVRNVLFFLFTRISPNHPMCQIVSLRGMEEGGSFLLAEEKEGILCPYLSILFSGYSTLAAESGGD